MKYGYDVKHDGIYYKAGEEVPQSVAMPVIEEEVPVEEAKTEAIEQKKRGRRSKQ